MTWSSEIYVDRQQAEVGKVMEILIGILVLGNGNFR